MPCERNGIKMEGNTGASLLSFVRRLALGIILGFIIFAMIFLKPSSEDDYKNDNTTNNTNVTYIEWFAFIIND